MLEGGSFSCLEITSLDYARIIRFLGSALSDRRNSIKDVGRVDHCRSGV